MNLAEAHSRLEEVVSAIRDLNEVEQPEWIARYPDLFALSRRGPLNPDTSDKPVTRWFENLQVELQLRTAEFLLAVNQ